MGIFYSKSITDKNTLSVNDEFIFTDTLERDTYFTDNPSSLKEGVRVITSGVLQEYDSSAWVDKTVIIQGKKGEDGTNGVDGTDGTNAPELKIQYSVDGLSLWSDTLDKSIHKYWRWSTDGGVSWSSDGVLFTSSEGATVSSGEGISVVDNNVSVISGSPSTLGGYKVGTGLQVDGEGRLSATASSEVTKVLPDEQSMLNLATESLRPYRVIRLDTNRLYFLNAGDSPAVLSNWFVGSSIDQVTFSFKNRTGFVEPEFGDYNADLIPITDKTTSANYKLVVDGGDFFLENISSSLRTAIGKEEDINTLTTQVNTLNNEVLSDTVGLVDKVGKLNTDYSTLNDNFNSFSNQKGQPSGIAPLGTASKVPSSFLPDYLPQSKRAWLGVLANRSAGTWYTNNSSNEMEVHIVTGNENNGGYINLLVRENELSTTFNFIGNSTSLSDLGLSSRAVGSVKVPSGWQYQVDLLNLGTRTIVSWYELS